MRSRVIAGLVLAAAVAVPTVSTGSSALAAPGLSAADQRFLVDAAHGVHFEVHGGELAGKRASAAAVRAFGARMVTDHGKEGQQLARVAAQFKVKLPDAPDDSQRDMLKVWGALDGGGFDRSYLPAEYADHVGDVAAYQDEAEHGDNAKVKAFAKAQLPVLREHLEMAAAALHGLAGGS